MNPIKDVFDKINSEKTLANFVSQFSLGRIASTTASTENFKGVAEGITIEINQRWWDPSSVYSWELDKHEAILSINGEIVSTVRFTGNS